MQRERSCAAVSLVGRPEFIWRFLGTGDDRRGLTGTSLTQSTRLFCLVFLKTMKFGIGCLAVNFTTMRDGFICYLVNHSRVALASLSISNSKK